MQITADGITSSPDIIMFSGLPNIIRFDNSDETSQLSTPTYSTYIFEILEGEKRFNENGDYRIWFGDHSISGTTDKTKVGGTTYFLPTQNTTAMRVYSALTIVDAMNSVPYIAANYNVYLESDTTTWQVLPKVIIRAKKALKYLDTDNLVCEWESGYVYRRTVDGISYDSMLTGKNDNLIRVDIYHNPNPPKIGGRYYDDDFVYVTTLSKQYYGEPVSFDITPVLSTLIPDNDYTFLAQFRCVCYGFSDGQIRFSQQTDVMRFTNGYESNFSMPYLTKPSIMMASNLTRGADREFANNTVLYTYYPRLDFSLYTAEGEYPEMNVIYRDTAGNEIYEDFLDIGDVENFKSLQHITTMLDEELFRKSAYIDVYFVGMNDVYRWNVIKPLNASDENEVRRVYWNGEYGGVNFFDFTGQRTEQRKIDSETYQKTDLDYYNGDERELNIVYKKNVEIEVTHATHFIEKNGTYLLYSLQNAKRAWIILNGKKYYINVTNLEISESGNASHIYQARISYTYSRNYQL